MTIDQRTTTYYAGAAGLQPAQYPAYSEPFWTDPNGPPPEYTERQAAADLQRAAEFDHHADNLRDDAVRIAYTIHDTPQELDAVNAAKITAMVGLAEFLRRDATSLRARTQ